MIKVASYCRVSTDKDDQANSFESQQRYFKEYIDRQPDWELYEIYADKGITGTSTKKRDDFNRMIRRCKQGKINLILTKSISRFIVMPPIYQPFFIYREFLPSPIFLMLPSFCRNNAYRYRGRYL